MLHMHHINPTFTKYSGFNPHVHLIKIPHKAYCSFFLSDSNTSVTLQHLTHTGTMSSTSTQRCRRILLSSYKTLHLPSVSLWKMPSSADKAVMFGESSSWPSPEVFQVVFQQSPLSPGRRRLIFKTATEQRCLLEVRKVVISAKKSQAIINQIVGSLYCDCCTSMEARAVWDDRTYERIQSICSIFLLNFYTILQP